MWDSVDTLGAARVSSVAGFALTDRPRGGITTIGVRIVSTRDVVQAYIYNGKKTGKSCIRKIRNHN